MGSVLNRHSDYTAPAGVAAGVWGHSCHGLACAHRGRCSAVGVCGSLGRRSLSIPTILREAMRDRTGWRTTVMPRGAAPPGNLWRDDHGDLDIPPLSAAYLLHRSGSMDPTPSGSTQLHPPL